MTTTSNRAIHWRAALALGALLGATVLVPTHAPAAEPKKEQKQQQPSDALRKQLTEAQKSREAKNWQDVIAKTNEAAANPKKQPYDQHIIDEWQGLAYANLGDWADAGQHFEATITDGLLLDEQKQERLKLLTQCFYNAGIKARDDKALSAGYLDKAIRYGTQALEGGAPTETGTMVVNSAYLKEDYKTVAKLEQQLVDAQVAKGEAPSAEQLDMLRSAYYKLKDDQGLYSAFKTTLAYHPTPDMWEQVLGVLATNASRNTTSELQLFRLMLEANVLKRSNDYTEFADSALRSGSPGEAKAVLEKGFADNVFTDTVKTENKKLLQSATVKAAADQATLDKEVPTTGQQAYGLGYAYFGYKQYDKAVAQLSKAVAQGGLKNEADARLLLGIAQLKAGHQDDALKTFQTVKGDESLRQIAQLWPYTVVKTGT
jgi:tetratricopeptide (TPR) repeat protein